MKKVNCIVKVEINAEKLKSLGYDNVEDYLDSCKFCVYDDAHDDVCISVEYDIKTCNL